MPSASTLKEGMADPRVLKKPCRNHVGSYTEYRQQIPAQHMSPYSPNQLTKVPMDMDLQNTFSFAFQGPHFEVLDCPQAWQRCSKGSLRYNFSVLRSPTLFTIICISLNNYR